MKNSLNNGQQGRHTDSRKSDGEVDDILCYMDQASFVGLRALGRQPVIHFTWIYPQSLSETVVNQLNHRLAQGLLGRVLQRSPLPWGRHRWVARTVPAPVTWHTVPMAAELLMERRTDLIDLPVDPEHGPAWRIVVQSLKGGGCALSILVSHTIADAKAASQAIADALAGRRLDPAFPPPSSRWTLKMMVRDMVQGVRELPAVWHALFALFRHARTAAVSSSSGSAPSYRIGYAKPEPIMLVPIVQVVMDSASCMQRAADLAISSTMLLAALTVRIAFRIGRVDADGRVKLVVPVSDRQPVDRRGNALRSITVMVDPMASLANPCGLQNEIKTALAELPHQVDDMVRMLPLIPYAPLKLARRMALQTVGRDLPVGCSLVGDLPLELHHPLGEVSGFQLSAVECFTESQLEGMGGMLLVASTRRGGQEFISVFGYAPNIAKNRAELAPFVQNALTDLGLPASVN